MAPLMHSAAWRDALRWRVDRGRVEWCLTWWPVRPDAVPGSVEWGCARVGLQLQVLVMFWQYSGHQTQPVHYIRWASGISGQIRC